MRFGLGVALESILVPALFLADLTVPAQPLKSFGLHLVSDVLWRSDFCSRHDVLVVLVVLVVEVAVVVVLLLGLIVPLREVPLLVLSMPILT